MSSGISLATPLLLSEDPEKIVREFDQAGKSEEIALFLYPEGWPDSNHWLVSSKGSIRLVLGHSHLRWPLTFEEAVRKVAEAQLLMRRAAVFAQAIRRLAREREISEDKALLYWISWEHGYDWPNQVPDGVEWRRMLQLLEERGREHFQRGLEILPLIPENSIQAPPGVSAWILSPPSVMGVRWGAVPRWDSLPDTTRIEVWLDVPIEEIVQALGMVASQKGRATLVITDNQEYVTKLIFRWNGEVSIQKNKRGSSEPLTIRSLGKGQRFYILKRIADEKTALRRAVVHAIAFRHLVEGRDLQEAAHLIALAEYGFAKLDDVPPASRFLIQDAADQHRAIIQTGMGVLKILEQPPSGGGHGVAHEDQAG
jgi:hypothetical protein